jgi:hypothetical protein
MVRLLIIDTKRDSCNREPAGATDCCAPPPEPTLPYHRKIHLLLRFLLVTTLTTALDMAFILMIVNRFFRWRIRGGSGLEPLFNAQMRNWT